MEHLALEIFELEGDGSSFAYLDADASITIIVTSQIFDSGNIWSYPFTLNVGANLHIFGTSGELHGSRLHEQLDKRRARLWVSGLPLYTGYLRLADEVDVDNEGNVEVTFESGQKSFKDMIDGGKANQVPLMDDVQIGLALWRKRAINWGVGMKAHAVFTDGTLSGSGDILQDGEKSIQIAVNGDIWPTQQYPRMVFPKGHFYSDNPDEPNEVDIDFLNTHFPYEESEAGKPIHPYCNIALCYQQYGYPEDENGKPDYSGGVEAKREYEVMPANRVNSAPNFYVIYWIRSLMTYLGIDIAENQMMNVEDMRRLFFVNTKCDYKVPDEAMRSRDGGWTYGRYQFGSNRLVPEKLHPRGIIKTEDSKFESTRWEQTNTPVLPANALIDKLPTIDRVVVTINSDVPNWSEEVINFYKGQNGYLHKAFATSECFPDEDIDTTIEAIQNAFGIRFLFDRDYKRVRIVLLRNIFRNPLVHKLKAEITGDITKRENSVRGFRLTFGAGEEDTAFFYRGFADKMSSAKSLWVDDDDDHDYSQWDLNASYVGIFDKITAFNKTCHVVPDTGNAYGVKIDKDAKSIEDMHPSLFGFADFMDAEEGNCSGEEETVEEINVGFKPAIQNDINFKVERDGDSREQRFALFVAESMQPRRIDLDDLSAPASYNDSDAYYDVDGKLYAKDKDGKYVYGGKMASGVVQPGSFAIASDTLATVRNLTVQIPFSCPCWSSQSTAGTSNIFYTTIPYDVNLDVDGHINEGYRLYLQDNFEPNDDGISPIETHEWGITLSIMRGSGSDATLRYEPDEDDNEGNSTWEVYPGSNSSAHPDTADDYGRIFDYDGSPAVVTPAEAIQSMTEMWPHSNINLIYSRRDVYRSDETYISGACACPIEKEDGRYAIILFALCLGHEGQHDLFMRDGVHIDEYDYLEQLRGKTVQEMYIYDSDKANGGLGVIIEIGGSAERAYTLLDLQKRAFYDTENTTPIIIGSDGVGTLYGRFSLKLRAEKPNPYYDSSIPDTVKTKADATVAMTKLFTTSNTDLLDRPKVSNSDMRAAGWNCPGDGYATVYSIGLAVQYSDGEVHEILWTPIKQDGTVKTLAQLQDYVDSFDNLSAEVIISQDTEHLILDIDTTERRAEVLHELQAIYYADDGEHVTPVNISDMNPRYLEITNPNLRRRGLMDQFYKEYSYWVTHARIANLPLHLELAEFLNIDMDIRQQIGDITGFVKKMQLTISNKTGMGDVDTEVMYL